MEGFTTTWVAASTVRTLFAIEGLSQDDLAGALSASFMGACLGIGISPATLAETILRDCETWEETLAEHGYSWDDFRAEALRAQDQEIARRREAARP